MSHSGSNTARSKERKPPLVIRSDEEFEQLMQAIDKELEDETVALPARQLMAGLRITAKHDVVLVWDPRNQTIVPGDFSPPQILLKAHDWMKRRYGKRLNVDFSIGRVVVPLHGALFSVRCPTVYGQAEFICDPTTVGQDRPRLGSDVPPVCNIIDLIDDITPDLARAFTPVEIVKLGALHASAMNAYLALHAIGDVPLIGEVLRDLAEATNHLMAQNAHFGLSKWSSLQAAEKVLKAFIQSKGLEYEFTHKLQVLVNQAAPLGLAPPPPQYITDLQCDPSVRYGTPQVTEDEAVVAQLIALEICEVTAQSICIALRRYVPRSSEPLFDGMPLKEYLKKHTK